MMGKKGMHSYWVKGSLLSAFADFVTFRERKGVFFCTCVWVVLGNDWLRF